MQTTTLARYGAPIAIVAGALMIITRLVIQFTTPTEIEPFKAYLLSTTHAVNSVVSILAFALLVIALVALYDREARSAGAFGALAFGAAVIGTMFMTGDWWYEAFAVPRLAEVAPDVVDTFVGGRLLIGGSDQLRAVRHRLDHVRGGEHSGSCYPARHLDHHPRGRPHVRRAARDRLPQRWGGSRAGVRLAGRMDAERTIMNPTQQPMNKVLTADEVIARTEGRQRRTIALGKVDLLLTVLGLLFLAGAYWINFLPEAVALLVLTVVLLTVTSRAWHARRGDLEYGLLRHPFRRDLRPYVLQCLNHWLFWALLGATILTGAFALVPAQIASLFSLPLPNRIPYQPLLIALGVGASMMAVLALVPRRRVQIATNVLVAIGTVFLAVQLVRISVPSADPVAINSPLAGEWQAVAGGRSVLLSHHFSPQTPFVRDALDFVRVVDGRGYVGDPKQLESWYGYDQPVLAPADGMVISVSDIHPDEPIGKTGVTPSHGNHIVLEIGDRRYAVLAHLKQGSAQVSKGERVQLGRQIATVGDSGNSLWPHLHFHVQDGPDIDTQARTLPIVFRDVVLARNGRTSTPPAAALRRGDSIHRIER